MKPWYRSRSLLIGGLVALSILGVGWSSYHHRAGPTFSTPEHMMYLGTAKGAVSFQHIRQSGNGFDFGFTYQQDTDDSLEETVAEMGDEWSFGPFRGFEYANGGRHPWFAVQSSHGWYVSWGFVFCLYLLVWVGLMVWFRRRARRAIAVNNGGEEGGRGLS